MQITWRPWQKVRTSYVYMILHDRVENLLEFTGSDDDDDGYYYSDKNTILSIHIYNLGYLRDSFNSPFQLFHLLFGIFKGLIIHHSNYQ